MVKRKKKKRKEKVHENEKLKIAKRRGDELQVTALEGRRMN